MSSAENASGVTRGEWAYAAVGAVGAVAVVASVTAAPGSRGAVGAVLAMLMLAIAVVDARHFIIPNELSAAAAAFAFVHIWVDGAGLSLDAVWLALLRGAAMALLFLAVRTVYARWRGRQGLGMGDVKLAGVAGLWLDWFTLPVVLEIAALAGIVIYLARQRILGRSVLATGRLPFGLFLAPAIWLGWLIEVMLPPL